MARAIRRVLLAIPASYRVLLAIPPSAVLGDLIGLDFSQVDNSMYEGDG